MLLRQVGKLLRIRDLVLLVYFRIPDLHFCPGSHQDNVFLEPRMRHHILRDEKPTVRIHVDRRGPCEKVPLQLPVFRVELAKPWNPGVCPLEFHHRIEYEARLETAPDHQLVAPFRKLSFDLRRQDQPAFRVKFRLVFVGEKGHLT